MYHQQPLSQASLTEAAYPQKHRHIIEVSGQGTVSAAPDRAVILLGTITDNMNLQTAQRENADTTSTVIASLLQLNIPKQHIQTANYRIEIQYNYEDGKQIFKGYKVTHMLQITLDKIEQTGLVVDTAVASGANSVSSVQFTTAHPEIYHNRALSSAVANAFNKALTIAQSLGVTLNRIPVQVLEESRSQEPIPYQTMQFAASAVTPIQPGELKITAALKVQFTYY